MSDEEEHPSYKKRAIFGRRQGRALGDERTGVMDSIFPRIQIPSSILTENHKTNPSDLFDKKHDEYWLEIGFGHGEHVAALARQNPNTGFIGAEPFVNGMAAFVKEIQNDPLDNIRALMDNGMIIAQSLKPSSLDGIYILNPDPWHKKRHHKRRIINQENLDIFARILKPGAKLIMTSDVEDMANWMCTHTCNHLEFNWTAQSIDDCYTPPEDWISTRYEQKGAKGAKKMIYLFFERKAHD